jgi:hypothetical protein
MPLREKEIIMNIAEKIYNEASKLPEHLAKEVLDF